MEKHMTMEQVRDWHRRQAKNNLESELYNQAPALCKAFVDRHTNMADAIDAHLRERESASARVTDGWQLVPIEPTHAMCGAPDVVWHPEAKRIYQQMLAAAPKPEKE